MERTLLGSSSNNSSCPVSTAVSKMWSTRAHFFSLLALLSSLVDAQVPLFLPESDQEIAQNLSENSCQSSQESVKKCAGKCGTHRTEHFECSCHESCLEFGNCCLDYAQACATEELKARQEELFEEEPNYAKPAQCLQALSPHKSQSTGFLLINKCLISIRFSDRKAREFCLRKPRPWKSYSDANRLISDYFPVMGSDGKMYKNRYCAACSGQQVDKYWTMRFRSLSNIDANLDISESLLRLPFRRNRRSDAVIPDGNSAFHKCAYGVISQCSRRSSWKSTYLCDSFQQIVSIANRRYKNIYCARCNGVSAETISRTSCTQSANRRRGLSKEAIRIGLRKSLIKIGLRPRPPALPGGLRKIAGNRGVLPGPIGFQFTRLISAQPALEEGTELVASVVDYDL